MTTQRKILDALLSGKRLKAIDAHSMFQCQENSMIRCIHYIRNGVNQDEAIAVESKMVESNGKKFSIYWIEQSDKRDIQQNPTACPKCGSWYRVRGKCNICGEVLNERNRFN